MHLAMTNYANKKWLAQGQTPNLLHAIADFIVVHCPASALT